MSLVLAHRGACGYAPENTLEAFRLAMEQGVDGFELDVHFSKDGHLVVIHDETVDRTTNGKGRVWDMTLAELQSLDACAGKEAYRGAKIPTLAQVLELIQGTDLIINIEIKTDKIFYPGIEEAVLNLVRQMGLENQIIYSSFNHFTLRKVRQLDKDAKLGMLFADVLVEPWKYASQMLDVQYLHPMAANINVPNFAEDSRAAGYGVNAWTINDPEMMKRCVEHDVSIITNYPDVAVAIRNGK